MIVSPAVVEADMSSANLQPVPDPLTIEALAITPLIAAQSLVTGFLNVLYSDWIDVETSLQSLVIEVISQGYQSAWTYLVCELGGLGPENQTNVVLAIPALHPTVLRWRVYIWAGLHLGFLLCGITFAYWQSHYRHPWVSNPTMIAFQLDTAGIFKEGRVANSKDPWDPTAKYPPGRLKLQDYDHERPGHPRAVTLVQEDLNKLDDVSEN